MLLNLCLILWEELLHKMTIIGKKTYRILVTMNDPELPEHNTTCSSGLAITGDL